MRTHLRTALTVIASSAILFTACEKEEDEGLLPNISFKTGGSYVSKDTTVAPSTTLLTGINASKTEDKDVLKVFSVTRTISGTDSTIVTENLSGAQGDSYSRDVTLTTRAVAGSEKYTYSISNRDGLVNTVTLTVTVQ